MRQSRLIPAVSTRDTKGVRDMGRHRAPESWLDQWLAMMREASMPVMHWTGAIVLHITAVWTYYEMTGH